MGKRIDRAAIKAEARGLIWTGRRSVIGAGAVYFGVTLVLSLLLLLLEMQPIAISTATIYLQLPMVNTFLTILIYLISALLAPGFVFFCMEIRRGVETPYAALFDGFEHAGKLIWANVVINVRILLWSFLFIVPGLVAMYRYRFAIYNIIENPSLTVTQAIELSKVQTYGMKGQLLACDLSFLGWVFLSMMFCAVPLIWVNPYMVLTDLGFYAVGKTRVSPTGGPEEPWSGWQGQG